MKTIKLVESYLFVTALYYYLQHATATGKANISFYSCYPILPRYSVARNVSF